MDGQKCLEVRILNVIGFMQYQPWKEFIVNEPILPFVFGHLKAGLPGQDRGDVPVGMGRDWF